MRLLSILFLIGACGGGSNGNGDGGGGDDGGGNNQTPMLIAGGGVADSPIAGKLFVYVVEQNTSTPIAGASVRIETATPMTATTDATGLATFSGVSGPQTISATASGHAAATWIGVAGANATLPLQSQSAVPTAHVTGTITGFTTLQAPSSLSHYNLAVILYSFLDDPSAPENSITQPLNGTTPEDTCVTTAVSTPACAWQLTTRIGMQVHTAVIVDGNTNGTPDDTSDDTYTLIGYAAGSPMTLTAGQQVTGETLAMVPAVTPLTITLPGGPSGLSHAIAIPELALGAAGRIVFPLPQVTGNASPNVLSATGAFAGHYEIVALATPNATTTAPFSSGFVHNVSGTAAVPAWLTAPTAVTGGATYSFTDANTVAFHTAQLSRGGTIVWNVTILDGSTTFSLPAITPDPIGSGTVTLEVSGADVPGFVATKFDVPTAKATLARASGAQTTFTH